MKTIIFYFSGTGNNYYIARQIAKELGETDLFPIKALRENKDIDGKYDWIGFISPSYYSHIPPFMSECMGGLRYKPHQKVFTVCGCGGNRGLAIQDMRGQVEKSGKKVQLEYMAIEPANYILSYGAFPKAYQNFTVWLTNRKARAIARDICANKVRKPLKKGLFYKASKEKRLQKSISEYAENGKQFKVNDNCVTCGMCARVCPVDNISIKDGEVVFGDHCNQCMACIQWCNKCAIYVNEKDKKRKRYHHPKVKNSGFNRMQGNGRKTL